jgi:PAS domain S-box-containing protein
MVYPGGINLDLARSGDNKEMESLPEDQNNILHEVGTESILSRIIDGSPVATFVLDTQHKVILWNRAIENLTGIKKEEITGTSGHRRAFYDTGGETLADLIVDQASAEEIEKRYGGKSRQAPLTEGAYDAEDYFLTGRESSGKWLHFTACPIRGKDDQIIGAIETLADITERKKAVEALVESEGNYRNLFESAMDAIWVNDRDGNILEANESAARLTGYSIAELNRADLSLFLDESSLTRLGEIQNKLLQGELQKNSYEQIIIRKDNSEAYCKVTTNLIVRNGSTSAFQNIARDTTEERRLFETQRYYAQEITRAQEEERKRIARELHDSTAQNLIALLHQLENLLNDKYRMPVRQAKVFWGFYENLRDILQEVRRFSRDLRPSILDDLGLMPALEWLTQEVESNYGINTSLVKVGEERRLSPEAELLFFRIVQESLTNVAKHAKASQAKVIVEFTEKKVKASIIDDGKGFSAPRNMGELTHSGKLGLLGMDERVKLMGGQLTLSSAPGHGTTVKIEAPV